LIQAVIKFTTAVRLLQNTSNLMKLAAESQEKNLQLPPPLDSPEFYRDSRVPPRDFEADLQRLFVMSRRQGFDLVMISFYPTPLTYRRILKNFAEAHGLVFLDFNDKFEKMSRDRLVENHPAYRELFEEYRVHMDERALRTNPMLGLTVNGKHPNRIGHYIVASDLRAAVLPLIPE
jgi:hypothetical protein